MRSVFGQIEEGPSVTTSEHREMASLANSFARRRGRTSYEIPLRASTIWRTEERAALAVNQH
jgi:hypothetical protein